MKVTILRSLFENKNLFVVTKHWAHKPSPHSPRELPARA